ncbi:unnamed protein product [Caenorhabditis angaria]|uniref:SSD domain-containing protein n=1 Tax=Caenorhabditis angaria TaxID=860376 RepID=A0A9P1I924_9PELO|nr:unnamed protein product [Caenorhabditis angaria]
MGSQKPEEQQKKHEPTKLVQGIAWFFSKWAHFVARNSIFLIVLCTILTLVGTFKIATTPNENDITGYTPYGARARDEFNVMTDFFSQNGAGIATFILIIPTRRENVLDPRVLREALRVERILSTEFKIRGENFQQYCSTFCQINEPFVQFAQNYLVESEMTEPSERINLSYPITTIYSQKMSIQPNFFGIQMQNSTDVLDPVDSRKISNLKSSKLIALQLRAERKPGWTTQLIKDYEMSITNYFEKSFNSSEVRVLTLSTSYVEAEVVRAGMSLLPFLIIGFIIMAIVSSVTCYFSALYMQQVSIHKFSLALAACLCPFMACGTALGTLFFCGIRFGSVLCVTPFLVLAIGVDDAYLMIHAWQRVTAERRSHPIPNDSPGSRLAEVLIEVGPAILISALTNILADVAGCFTSSPEITLLAYGNMSCIFMDFLYQITFYSAIMCITGYFEMRGEEQKKHITKIACGQEADDQSQTTVNSFNETVKQKVAKFLEGYLSILTNLLFQLFVLTIWAGFLAICIYGITIMNINLSPKKLFEEGSPLIEMDELRVNHIVPHFFLANVFVTKPGNLSDPKRLAKLNKFVEEMEKVRGSWGPQGTNYFIRDMIEFQNSLQEETGVESEGLDMQNLPMFLGWPEYTFWAGFVQYHNHSEEIKLDRFWMTFAVYGEDLRSWNARGEALGRWRKVVDQYPDFGLSVYSDDGIYVDLIENMPTDAWQSALATLACMALVCFIFMYDVPTVTVATVIIASVMTGILGLLSLTGTDLDPIVIASSFIFSTSLCVLALKFTAIYMSNAFAKVMIICMVLVVLHSLILLPVLFAFFNRFSTKKNLGKLIYDLTVNENDITGYTPYGARARDEFNVMTDFFSQNGAGIATFVLIIPTRRENVLDPRVLREALRVEQILSTEFTIRGENFQQYCSTFCQINEPFVQFAQNYLVESEMTEPSDRINLSYPITTIYSQKMSIQPNFFGIQMMSNSTSDPLEDSARKIRWTTQLIKDYEMSITNYFEKSFNSSEVRVLTLSTSYVEAEVVRAGMSLLPFLIIGFIIMAIVSSVTCYFSALYMQQVSIHKFSLALAACLCPFMACGTALGTLFFCGIRFGSVLCVTPFLVLAIGVDDAYLMIHAWQRVTAERRSHPIPNDSPGSRLAEVLIEVGPAILISALTNILADVAGCFTSSPEITLLAYGNMSCIFMDFLYQITFYSAIMCITGYFEMRGEEQKKHITKIACGQDLDDQSQTTVNSFNENVKQKVAKFLEGYLSILTNLLFQLFVLTLWAGFLAICIYGITIMNINLSPKKLLAKLNKFVEEMEKVRGSWGPQGTNYFIRDMIEFQNSLQEETGVESEGLDMQNLPMFLGWPEYTFWAGFVQYHNHSEEIKLDRFWMTFAVYGEDLRSWNARGEALGRWRKVVDQYPDFGLSVYSDDGIYVDLIENMPTDAWQSALATLACMALVCFIFMYDVPTVTVATVIIASVMTGILGLLSLTGTDLDPIVMSALIISIGFSVDIPAHISYHYHCATSHEIHARLHETLSSVGFPALQASFSTSLCVLALKFTAIYMSNAFAKVMIICMVLVVLHSLILLPVLFAFFNRFSTKKISEN